MKRQILISLILLSLISKINAQEIILPDGVQSNIWIKEGNMGIGTPEPTGSLEINKENGKLALTMKRGDNNVANIGSGSSLSGENGILQLFNNNAENIRLYTTGDSWINGGNLGIGTSTPRELVELNKENGKLSLTINRGANSVVNIGSGSSSTGENGILQMYNNNVENIRLYTTGDSWINGGNLGIGTPTPKYTLDVIGTISASEIIVKIKTADFVFENDYKLMPLDELEKFVIEQKHLPEIPSANEMEKNGTELGDLNSKLLQKMEEMTLYMIEQNKKIEGLQNEIIEMKSASK